MIEEKRFRENIQCTGEREAVPAQPATGGIQGKLTQDRNNLSLLSRQTDPVLLCA